jgi:hypothetical protein
MATAIEPMQEAIARIKSTAGSLTSVKRFPG